VGGVVYGALYVAAWFVLPGGRRFMMDAKGLFKELMGKKPASPRHATVASAGKATGDAPAITATSANSAVPAIKVA
jgi:hypothetical protein